MADWTHRVLKSHNSSRPFVSTKSQMPLAYDGATVLYPIQTEDQTPREGCSGRRLRKSGHRGAAGSVSARIYSEDTHVPPWHPGRREQTSLAGSREGQAGVWTRPPSQDWRPPRGKSEGSAWDPRWSKPRDFRKDEAAVRVDRGQHGASDAPAGGAGKESMRWSAGCGACSPGRGRAGALSYLSAITRTVRGSPTSSRGARQRAGRHLAVGPGLPAARDGW